MEQCVLMYKYKNNSIEGSSEKASMTIKKNTIDVKFKDFFIALTFQ